MAFLGTYREAARSMSRPVRFFLASTILYWLGMTLAQLYLNFYLQALGLDQQWVGIINAAPNLTVVLLTFVVGSFSSRIGPWRAILVGTAVVSVGAAGTALSSGAWWVFAATIITGAGGAFIYSNSGPFMMVHTEEKARATIFSLQAALGTVTGFAAYLGGGQLPHLLSGPLGQPSDSAGVMRLVLMLAALLYAASLVPAYLAGKGVAPRPSEQLAIPAGDALAPAKVRLISDWGLVARLILPGAIIGLGAGMTMPFMNVYIEHKFSVDFQGLGQIFAWSALGTAAALMVQPVLAGKVGKVKSVVLVQASSLPFLLVLGYMPFFPLVVVALFVRAALMNMGNPVFAAYSMERIPERERATFSSLSASTWSLGWAAGSWFSGALRGAIGFAQGFNVLFGLMALLYATSTVLMWVWFVGQENKQRGEAEKRASTESRPAAA